MYDIDFLKTYLTFGEFEINFVLEKIYIPKDGELASSAKRNSKIKFIVNEKEFVVKMNSNRYKVFNKSISCSICKLNGSKFLLQQSIIKDPSAPLNVAHFNLYAEDINNINNGKLILMTADHIKPLSKDGTDSVENLQTCCVFCNTLKGNKLY